MRVITLLFVALSLLTWGPSSASAGYNDPWWLLYKRGRDTTVVYRRGPYSSSYACQGQRYQLPYGAVYLGCVQ